jgi:polysaccharide pyruvyl transferase WcaK-like protein
MRILVEQGSYHLNNMGDVAMLQVAVSRLKQLFPNSTIQIFTNTPDRLEQYCPGTIPLSPKGREVWSYPLSKFPSGLKLVNNTLNYFDTSYLGQRTRKTFPHFTQILLQHRLRNCPSDIKDLNDFTCAIFNADLLLLSGGGYMNDIFPYSITRALATIDLAGRLHKPVMMLGLGLGPLTDVDILAQAKQTLPSVKRIGLREQVAGLPLLKSIGVSPEQVVVTGDDAVELAYEARSPELDRGIGVNLRVSHYSEVTPQVFNAIRTALVSVAETHQAPLIPAPISRHSDAQNEQPDSVAIQKLIEGYSDCSDGGFHLDTPLKVIQQVSRCRVMVTASYHAGVFALSQGIPVVGLVKSKYYVDKFLGLADQFGQGCEIILLDEDNLQDRLIQTINQLWSDAETLRPRLLESAVRQIQQGRLVYESLRELGLPCR